MSTGAQPGDIIQGQSTYRLEEWIAVGGLAEVWRATVLSGPARDVEKLEVAALKFPNEPELEEELRNEAKTLDYLWEELPKVMQRSAVALVEVLEHGASVNNGYFIAMRYYDKTSINRFYPEPQRVPIGVMANVLQAVAPTLDAAHRLSPQVLHRDIKLSNVLLNSADRIVLTDFMPDGIGNPRYAAPELVRNYVEQSNNPIDERADIYSLGVMLYRAMTGHYPIEIAEAESTDQEFQQAYDLLITRNVPVPVPDDIPGPLYDVLKRALQRSRSERYGSCLELANDFVTKKSAAPTVSDTTPYVPANSAISLAGQSSRRAWLGPQWIAGAGALCLLALAWLLLLPRPQPPSPVAPSPTSIPSIKPNIIAVVNPTDTPEPTSTPTATPVPPTSTRVPPTQTPTKPPAPPPATPVRSLPAGCLDNRNIISPASDAKLRRGPIEILGNAYPQDFERYKVEWAQGNGADDQSYTLIREIRSRAQGNVVLAIWETGALPPGRYSLRLKVVKESGNWYDPPCVITVELQ